MKYLSLTIDDLNLQEFYPKNKYLIHINLEEKDLNKTSGEKVLRILNKLQQKDIKFKIMNSLPNCMFHHKNKKRTVEISITNNCFECKGLFQINRINQIVFCNYQKGKYIDQYKNKNELYKHFLSLDFDGPNFNICRHCPERDNSCKTYRCLGTKRVNDNAISTKDNLVIDGKLLDKTIPYLKSRIFCFINYYCNNNCKHCFLGEKNRYKNKDTQEIKEFIKNNCQDYKTINFLGGEPTLNKNIIDLIKFAKDCGLFVQMFSNCRKFADYQFAKQAVDAGLDQVTITFHSHKENIHNSITQRKESFKQTIQGIKNLKTYNIKLLHAQIILHRKNFRDLTAIAKYAVSLGIDYFTLEALVLNGSALEYFNKLSVSLTAIIPHLQKTFDFLIKKGLRFSFSSLPLCLIDSKYWEFAHNHRYVTMATNNSFNNNESPLIDTNSGLSLSKKCIDCQLKIRCPGTWSCYFVHYGCKELKPFL